MPIFALDVLVFKKISRRSTRDDLYSLLDQMLHDPLQVIDFAFNRWSIRKNNVERSARSVITSGVSSVSFLNGFWNGQNTSRPI